MKCSNFADSKNVEPFMASPFNTESQGYALNYVNEILTRNSRKSEIFKGTLLVICKKEVARIAKSRPESWPYWSTFQAALVLPVECD